jgi:uncharacterized membrane protein
MQTSRRIHSIDVARGVAMILMAIDHVRVYAGVPPGGPRPGVFFTRWITNFVAPAFAFLSGTSAYLLGRKLGSTRALSRYLLTMSQRRAVAYASCSRRSVNSPSSANVGMDVRCSLRSNR